MFHQPLILAEVERKIAAIPRVVVACLEIRKEDRKAGIDWTAPAVNDPRLRKSQPEQSKNLVIRKLFVDDP
jgi:hypothetical protein